MSKQTCEPDVHIAEVSSLLLNVYSYYPTMRERKLSSLTKSAADILVLEKKPGDLKKKQKIPITPQKGKNQ